METVTIPRARFKELEAKERKLAEISKGKVDWDFVQQFKDGLEDLKHGRVRRVA